MQCRLVVFTCCRPLPKITDKKHTAKGKSQFQANRVPTATKLAKNTCLNTPKGQGSDKDGDQGTDKGRDLLSAGCMLFSVPCSCPPQLRPNIYSVGRKQATMAPTPENPPSWHNFRRWGYVGYIWRALEKGYLEHPGSACCTDNMSEIFVHFGRCLGCLLPLFVNRQLPCLYTNSLHGLLRPLMHHKSLWCVKGLSLGVQSG